MPTINVHIKCPSKVSSKSVHKKYPQRVSKKVFIKVKGDGRWRWEWGEGGREKEEEEQRGKNLGSRVALLPRKFLPV